MFRNNTTIVFLLLIIFAGFMAYRLKGNEGGGSPDSFHYLDDHGKVQPTGQILRTLDCGDNLYNVDFASDQGDLQIFDCGDANDVYGTGPQDNVVEVESNYMLFVDVEGSSCTDVQNGGNNDSFYETVEIDLSPACVVEFEAGYSFVNISVIPGVPDLECNPGPGQDYLQILYSVDGGSSFDFFDGGGNLACGGDGDLSSGPVDISGSGTVIFLVEFGSQSVTEGISIDYISVIDLSPTIDPIDDFSDCVTSYTLPSITGDCLTGDEAYFTESGGGGDTFDPGDEVTESGTYYAATPDGCGEVSFTVDLDATGGGDAGSSTSTDVCSGDVVDLADLLGFNIDPGSFDDDDGSGADVSDPNAVDFDGVDDGTYDFTYTVDNGGCPGDQATVTVTVLPTGEAFTPDPLGSCSTNMGGQAVFDLNGITEEVNGNTGETVRFFTDAAGFNEISFLDWTTYTPGSVPTTIYAAVGDLPCLSEIVEVDLVAGTEPTVTPSVTNANCSGAATGSIQLTVSGSGPFSYEWADGPNSEDRTGLTAGDYTVSVTYGGGCVLEESFTVGEPNPIVIDSCTVVLDASGQTVADGRATVAVSGGTGPYIITFQDVDENVAVASGSGPLITLDNLLPSDYVVTSVSDNNGCVANISCSFTVGFSAACLTVDSVITMPPLCVGDSTATIEVFVSDTVGPLSFQWSDTSFIGGLMVQNAAPGTYALTITDTGADSCQTIETDIVVTDQSPLVVGCSVIMEASGRSNADGSARLDISGGTPSYSLLVSGPTNVALTDTVGPIDLNGLLPGDYLVQVVDANGCEESCSFQLNIMPGGCAFELVDSTVGISCGGAADGQWRLTLTDTVGPMRIQWSVPGFDDQPVAIVGPGTYSVTVTDLGVDGACTTVLSGATFTEPADTLTLQCGELNAASAPDAGDGTATFVLGGGRPAFSLDITGPQDSSLTGLNAGILDIGGLLPGDYQATLTDAAGCISASCEFTIGIIGVCGLSIDGLVAPISCAGAADASITLEATGNSGPLTFDWGDPQYNGDSVLTGLAAGNYSVIVTQEVDCADTLTFIISEPDSLDIVCATGAQASGPANMDGTGTVTINGGRPPYRVVLVNGPNRDTTIANTAGTTIFTSLGVATYTVEVTDGSGCFQQCQFTTTAVGCTLNATFTTEPISCNGENDGSLRLLITGNNGPVTIDWNVDAFDGLQDLDQLLGPGSYSATISDATGCVFPVGPIEFVNPDTLTLSCEVLAEVSAPNAADGVARAIIAGGAAPYRLITRSLDLGVEDTIVLNVADTILLSGLGGGVTPGADYALILEDASGCQVSCDFLLLEPACPVLDIVGIIDSISCRGDSTGSITINVPNAVAPISYVWTGGNFPDTASLDSLTAGSYTVNVTDGNGCTGSSTFVVNEPATLPAFSCQAESDETTIGADDGEASITVQTGGSGPYTITITGALDSTFLASAGELIRLSGLSPGTYVVDMSDDNGCTAMGCSFDVNPGSCGLEVMATTEAEDCAGPGQINLMVTGNVAPVTFDWSTDSLDGQQNPVVTAGDYSVTVTSSVGCVDSTTITVPFIDNGPGLVITDNGSVCPGEDIILNLSFTGTAPFSADIQTTPGGLATFSDLSVDTSLRFSTDQLSDQNFSIEVISFVDDRGCSQTINDARTITLGTPDTVDRSDILCRGSSIDIGGRSFSENNPSDTFFVNDANCGTLYRVDIDFIEAVPSDTSEVTLCAGDSLVIFGVTFTENSPEGPVNTGSMTTSGCDSVVFYRVDFLPVAMGMETQSACAGDTVRRHGLVLTVANPSGVATLPGAAANGCDSLVSVFASFPLPPEVTLRGDADICLGDSAALVFSVSRAENVDVVLTDDTGTNFSFSGISDGDTLRVLPTTSVTYVLTAASSGNPCPIDFRGDATISISTLAGELSPGQDVNGFQITCNGDRNGSLSVAVTDGVEPFFYQWSTGDSSATISNLGPGNYSLLLTDANGCARELSATLQEPSPLFVSTVTSGPGCEEEEGVVEITDIQGGVGPYEFSFDNTFFTPINGSSVQERLLPGDYTVFIRDGNDCPVEGDFLVPEGAEPELVMPVDLTLRLGDSTILIPQLNFTPDSIRWTPSTFGLPNNRLEYLVRPMETTRYFLEASDEAGCQVTGSVLVTVDERVALFVPNIFSPNVDGINDLLRVFSGPSVERVEEFRVFDRWGEMVYFAQDFSADNSEVGWDGTLAGEPLNAGVFIYFVRARLTDGRLIEDSGDVVLRR